MVITLIYKPPSFPHCVACKGNSNGRIVRHRLVQLAMKLVVARFCRAKVHEEGAECEWSENVMQLSHHHQLASYEPAAM